VNVGFPTLDLRVTSYPHAPRATLCLFIETYDVACFTQPLLV